MAFSNSMQGAVNTAMQNAMQNVGINQIGQSTALPYHPPVNPNWNAPHVYSPGNAYSDFAHGSNMHLLQMIASRFKLMPGAMLPFDFINAFKDNERVIVFVVHRSQPVTIEDEWAMFPSDKLVTQLRLLQQ